MTLILNSASIVDGLGNQSAQALMCLRTFAALTPPVTEALMRSTLEASQPVGFISDEDWLSFVGVLGSLGLDETSLTNAERAVINTLRTVVSPPPSQACCTTSGLVPANGDGKSSITGYDRAPGVAPYDTEVELKLSGEYTCDIISVNITLTPIGLAPAVTSTNPFTVTFNSCSTSGDSLFSNLWVTFGTDPATFTYTVDLDYKDANGVSIATYTAAYTLNL